MFTRAKQKMEIFTSILSSDIIVGEHSSRGVRAFKAFLNFIETGRVTHSLDITNKGFDSDFEESVYNILHDAGYNSVPQVGVAGYFIDLSVVSEKNKHDFVLAIECDGATYHSSSHTESTLAKNKYTQMFLSDKQVKDMLIELRDTKIASEFKIDRRSILSDIMIEQFIEHKPIDMDEFRSSIPKRYRNTNMIDIEQMKYLNDIFDIMELADE